MRFFAFVTRRISIYVFIVIPVFSLKNLLAYECDINTAYATDAAVISSIQCQSI